MTYSSIKATPAGSKIVDGNLVAPTDGITVPIFVRNKKVDDRWQGMGRQIPPMSLKITVPYTYAGANCSVNNNQYPNPDVRPLSWKSNLIHIDGEIRNDLCEYYGRFYIGPVIVEHHRDYASSRRIRVWHDGAWEDFLYSGTVGRYNYYFFFHRPEAKCYFFRNSTLLHVFNNVKNIDNTWNNRVDGNGRRVYLHQARLFEDVDLSDLATFNLSI